MKQILISFAIIAAYLPCQSQNSPLNVAILIYNEVQIIDYTGPYEVFGQLRPSKVFTVAESHEPVTTRMGMKVIPNFSFNDLPKPDVLVIPGGTVDVKNRKIIQWIQTYFDSAKVVLSVCNGAFLLAEAGLLDGKHATTTALNLERLESQYPKIKVVKDKRFVDDGKVVTSAGVSAGIDAAIHVVEKLSGKQRAKNLALGIEYNWDSEGNWTRSQLADMNFMDALMDIYMMKGIGKISTEKSDGNTEQWEYVMRFVSTEDAKIIHGRLNEIFQRTEKWDFVRGESMASKWKFKGFDNEIWTGQLALESGETNSYRLSIGVKKNL
jgi:putative intracellular protease/amidase